MSTLILEAENINKLKREKQTQIISSLVEGNSLRATARMCDVVFNTVLKLVPQIGAACAEYQDKTLRNLSMRMGMRRFTHVWTIEEIASLIDRADIQKLSRL